MQKVTSVEELSKLCQCIRSEQDNSQPCIVVCGGTGCTTLGSHSVYETLQRCIEDKKLAVKVHIKKSGCHGFCENGPLVVIYPKEIFYQKVSVEDAPKIIEETIINERVVGDLLYKDPVTGKKATFVHEVPFYNKQNRIIFSHNNLDPTDINEYISVGGYQALGKALSELSPDGVVNVIKDAGLRGRGGAGFPAGEKWEVVSKAEGNPKYILCNAFEGDPGAFMDRSLMEGDPHAIIEGMTIAGYATGARYGYVYICSDYSLAVQRITKAIDDAKAIGFLGENILGKGFSFDIEIKEGAGAFVCGDETAQIASIEGRRGQPRVRPPYPAVSGLWGKPTCVNNVETFVNVPPIVLKGADWFKQIGTKGSPGTKIFALSGKINNTGLVEVPMGTTLREIIFGIGGGIPKEDRKFKAVQLGGPSGGCVPARFLDIPVDFDSVKDIGAMVGSGGAIVLDDGNCMVDVARFFLEFSQDESCGKCTPCRVGTQRMLDILNRIAGGNGKEGDIDTLVELGGMICDASLCGLGQGAPNPALSAIKYFREEYEEHIRDKHCRAAVCEALVKSPCQNSCPAGINVPEYVALIGLKEYGRATDIIRKRNPFPSVCGYVCNHPCEILCRRGDLDESIAIKHLKRFATDNDAREEIPIEKMAGPTGKKVAIIGSGPAGLTTAFYLSLMGHEATVFEALPAAGGMLTVGIPEYRLPRDILKAEIDYIKRAGVEIKTNSPIDTPEKFDELLKDYNAVFVAVGAHEGLKLNIPGEDLKGALDGTTFLRRFNLGESMKTGKKVAVIGAGNVAMDSARTALRLGAKEVTIVYRRSREEMPADKEEIIEAEEEGIKFKYLTAPIEVIGNGKVTGIRCIAMRLGTADKSGRRRPEPVPGTEFNIEVDTLIAAIGQIPNLSFIDNNTVRATRKDTIATTPGTTRTAQKNVFAGGDAVLGPATVIKAIGAGQKAAVEIDRFLGGPGLLPENTDPLVAEEKNKYLEEGVSDKFRPKMPCLNLSERIQSFKVVACGYDEESAVEEARRCLRCDLEE